MINLHTELTYEIAKKLFAAGMPLQFIWRDEEPRLHVNATYADAGLWLMERGITVTVSTTSGAPDFAAIEVGPFRRIILRGISPAYFFLDRVIIAALAFIKP